jgi:hypothetical protein
MEREVRCGSAWTVGQVLLVRVPSPPQLLKQLGLGRWDDRRDDGVVQRCPIASFLMGRIGCKGHQPGVTRWRNIKQSQTVETLDRVTHWRA